MQTLNSNLYIPHYTDNVFTPNHNKIPSVTQRADERDFQFYFRDLLLYSLFRLDIIAQHK